MIEQNKLKAKIKKGIPVLGTWNTIGSPMFSEILALSGLDFIIIDFEHGPFQIDHVHDYVNRCENNSCTPIFRIPSNSDWMTLQVLDQGGHGIITPHIEDKKSAQLLVDSVKYFPIGKRGFTPFTKAGGFSNLHGEVYAEKANEFTLAALIIESKDGLANLDEILEIEDIDVVYFGAYDLSQELGVPGQTRHPSVLKEIMDGVIKVNDKGKYAGGFVAQSKDDIKWLLDMGMLFITYEVDSSIVYKAVHDVTDWFEKECTQ
jgi:4-hydroxy-2-oxoheptanedioate aldolase